MSQLFKVVQLHCVRVYVCVCACVRDGLASVLGLSVCACECVCVTSLPRYDEIRVRSVYVQCATRCIIVRVARQVELQMA